MSQRRRSRRHIIDDDDLDEMPPPRASQHTRRTQNSRESQNGPRASQAGPSSRNDFDDSMEPELSQATQGGKVVMPEDEENNLVASVIRYLLVADRTKTMIPRANIVKHAMPSHGKYFKFIIGRVTETLKEIFGYNLVQLEGGKYFLTNNIGHEDHHLELPKNEKKELVLLFIALGHIFMTNDSGCQEQELFDLFRKLDIIEENNFMHEYFGDVKYLLTDKFVKQGYLELVNVDRSDPPTQHYQWGPRAEHELRPRSVLEFMSKIFGGRPLNAWPKQFKLMQDRENLEVL